MALPPEVTIHVRRTAAEIFEGRYLPELKRIVPRRMSSVTAGGSWPLELTVETVIEDSQVVVDEVRIRRPAGAPGISTKALRLIPLARIVRSMVDTAAQPARWDDGKLAIEVFGPDDSAIPSAAIQRAMRPEVSKRSHERHVELMRTVAMLYREALAADVPRPRRHVARQMGYSNSYVGKLLFEARRTDPPLLGAAPGVGRSGEIRKGES